MENRIEIPEHIREEWARLRDKEAEIADNVAGGGIAPKGYSETRERTQDQKMMLASIFGGGWWEY